MTTDKKDGGSARPQSRLGVRCDGGREMRKRRKRSRPGCCHDTGCRIIGRLIRFHHKALIACFRHDWSESSSYLQEQEQQQTCVINENPSPRLRSRFTFHVETHLPASTFSHLRIRRCADAGSLFIEGRLQVWMWFINPELVFNEGASFVG